MKELSPGQAFGIYNLPKSVYVGKVDISKTAKDKASRMSFIADVAGMMKANPVGVFIVKSVKA